MRPKKVILLVDGDAAALSLHTFLLETHGYRVLSAGDSFQALDTLAAACSADRQVDLLMAAAELPEMDGDELCRVARTVVPEIRCLLFSQTLDQIEVRHANAFLPVKSPTIPELLVKVRQLTAGKRGPKRRDQGMSLLPPNSATTEARTA